ncbi:MAG: nucleotide pyrophosphohydrolase [Thermoguttaceae bacterium]|jgi:NTP pyrophosphatase (non-canonical NTP hydrolase)
MPWTSDADTTLGDIKEAIAGFTSRRDWQPFHTPKNLAMAVASEAAELMAHFRWTDDAAAAAILGDADSARAIRHEAADVLVLLAELANVAGIDLARAVAEKMALNEDRYPVEKARGTAAKYDRL